MKANVIAATLFAVFSARAFADDDGKLPDGPDGSGPAPMKFPIEFPTGFPISFPTGLPISFPTGLPLSFPTGFPIPTGFPGGFPTGFPTGFATGPGGPKPPGSSKPPGGPKPTNGPGEGFPGPHPTQVPGAAHPTGGFGHHSGFRTHTRKATSNAADYGAQAEATPAPADLHAHGKHKGGCKQTCGVAQPTGRFDRRHCGAPKTKPQPA
ncbi:hypothetical protein CSUB01_08829 [Colletotrichum sublineola]|uniref:Uncharacterized protein n=1 Tax=Colletotrichum sublineola TaxID=1173701 RepID=A0A066XRR0_COLSU|nr:hypothetical protein CSUB01_08829 [Colletotrichum sublineola]